MTRALISMSPITSSRTGMNPREQRRFCSICQMVSWLLVGLMLGSPGARASAEIGSVVFAKGAVSAVGTDGGVRLLARDSAVFQQEKIATAAESFAVIRFRDDTKMSIRPNSEVVIDRFDESTGREAAEFSLLKGGLRAITGAIGAKRPENVRFRTRAASIGIRGTDLVLRLCEENECRLEELSMLAFEPVKTECATSVDDYQPGLFFAVLEGAVYSEKVGSRIDLEAIGSGYANDHEMTCMNVVPRFILHDKYLNAIDLDWREIEVFDLLGIDPDDYPACEVL
ncbi:MAG: hypothetical protein DWQ08_14430 [Proteobacteria bacterium]|nr:MAG: hypothetical protein DWQ08_14430 [Pseudomonadota bacterium]